MHKGAWIFTEGLREGVGRCVGEAVRDHATAASSVSHNKVIAIGIPSWGLVHNRQQLINPEVLINTAIVYLFMHIHRLTEKTNPLNLPLSLSRRVASQQSIMLRTNTVTRVASTKTTRPSYWWMMGVWVGEGARMVSGPGWRTTYPVSALGYGVRQSRVMLCFMKQV